MPSGKPYPDGHAALVAWLNATFPTARAVMTLPRDLGDVLPVVQPVRIGGGSSEVVDTAIFDIDVYGASSVAAMSLAIAVQTALTRSEGAVVPYDDRRAVLTAVRCTSGPAWRPYDNPAVSRVGATYSVALKAA